MSSHINAASRLHAILVKVAGMTTSATSLAVWETAFQIQGEANDSRKVLIISERLRWLHQELDILRSQMKEANFREKLYVDAFDNIEHAISTLLLPTAWSNGAQYLKPETLVALDFCSDILPDEESLIDPQAFEEIRSMVLDLEKMLVPSNLPESLVSLFRHHIDLINNALDQYPFIGAVALREAARTALGEIVEANESLKTTINQKK